MDTSGLESAYERVLDLAATGEFGEQAGEWPAAMVVAHLAVIDDLLLSALRDVLANKPTHHYDNEPAVDDDNLRSQGTLPEVIDKLRTTSRQVVDLARQLGPLEDTPVVVRLRDGDQLALDGETMPIGRLLQIHADMHLPGHLSQLEGLRS